MCGGPPVKGSGAALRDTQRVREAQRAARGVSARGEGMPSRF